MKSNDIIKPVKTKMDVEDNSCWGHLRGAGLVEGKSQRRALVADRPFPPARFVCSSPPSFQESKWRRRRAAISRAMFCHTLKLTHSRLMQ